MSFEVVVGCLSWLWAALVARSLLAVVDNLEGCNEHRSLYQEHEEACETLCSGPTFADYRPGLFRVNGKLRSTPFSSIRRSITTLSGFPTRDFTIYSTKSWSMAVAPVYSDPPSIANCQAKSPGLSPDFLKLCYFLGLFLSWASSAGASVASSVSGFGFYWCFVSYSFGWFFGWSFLSLFFGGWTEACQRYE